nr:hypothetical protein CFP56_24528 [Quercus suber]
MRATLAALPAFLTLTLAASIPKRQASRHLVQYVQTFHDTSGNPLSLLPLLNDGTRVTHVNLAALHVNSDGTIHLNDASPDDSSFDQVFSDVATLQNSGIKVLFMIGGAAAGSYPTLCGTAVPATIQENFYGPLLDIIKRHNINGVDLDIEEQVDISCPLVLLQRFRADMGDDFVLSMAPVASELEAGGSGLSGVDYVSLDSQAVDGNGNKLVNYYNAQFYNGWGDFSTPDNYNSIISSGSWDPSRINAGVLDNSNDGGSGFVGLSTLTSVITQLTSGGGLGGVAGWEYWDAGANDNTDQPGWVKSVGNALFDGTTTKRSADKRASAGRSAVPWPASHAALTAAGVPHFEAVRALNVTGGSLEGAARSLNLSL